MSIIHSDYHIHSQSSYDGHLKVIDICKKAKAQGLDFIGITDHLNLNDIKFKSDIIDSSKKVYEAKKDYPFVTLGVELTPIAKVEFDHINKMGSQYHFKYGVLNEPYDIELGMTKEELIALGVRYGIGATHWRVDYLDAPWGMDKDQKHMDLDGCIKEWYRQQMYLVNDERVTILGHPWYHPQAIWYDDFSLIPDYMNKELAMAVKENKKIVECNSHFFENEKVSEKFRNQYAEFLRELFEMGIKITYGSDSHWNYDDYRPCCEKYLLKAGFKDGDFYTLSEEDLW